MSSQLSAQAITAQTAITRISVRRCSILPWQRGSSTTPRCRTRLSMDMILSSPARGHVIVHQARASDRNFMRLPWGSPQGGGRGKKGANSKERDEREALGRSRGGYGAKACVIADGLGRAVAFILAPGQAHELPHAVPLLERLPGVPKWVVADRGLS